jgi:phage gpG-like protein
MPNHNAKKFNILQSQYKGFRRRLPNKVAITAVNFFKRNFKVGGFVDRPFRKWKKSKYPGKKGTTMVQSGKTRRDIKKLKVSQRRVVVGIGGHKAYAEIHNTGGKLPITPKMRRFFWAKWYETKNDFWRNMALTKKTHLDIPQRQFIGDSKVLEITVERMIIKELKKALG